MWYRILGLVINANYCLHCSQKKYGLGFDNER
jgi:hypothetical protein